MYLRRCYRNKDGGRHGYWALVEVIARREARGSAWWLTSVRWMRGTSGIHQQAAGAATVAQRGLFLDTEPQWVEVDLKRTPSNGSGRSAVLGWARAVSTSGTGRFLEQTLPAGREEIPWPVMAQILILARLCEPSSELHLAERFYEASALSDLLGVPANKVNEDRLYRSLDQLLPQRGRAGKTSEESTG